MSGSDKNRTIRWPGDPAELTAEAVDFEAVAHVLGNTCCWGGRTLRFYSLAQRAVTVCKAVQALGGTDDADRRALALHALLADAWRAWLPELWGTDETAKTLEKHARQRESVQLAVLEAAEAPAELPRSWDLALELRRRMAEAAECRDLADAAIGQEAESGPLFPPLRERIRPLRPDVAAKRWLEALQAAVLRTADQGAADQGAADQGAADQGASEKRAPDAPQAPGGGT